MQDSFQSNSAESKNITTQKEFENQFREWQEQQETIQTETETTNNLTDLGLRNLEEQVLPENPHQIMSNSLNERYDLFENSKGLYRDMLDMYTHHQSIFSLGINTGYDLDKVLWSGKKVERKNAVNTFQSERVNLGKQCKGSFLDTFG